MYNEIFHKKPPKLIIGYFQILKGTNIDSFSDWQYVILCVRYHKMSSNESVTVDIRVFLKT
mgnify:CR=1 FL=1